MKSVNFIKPLVLIVFLAAVLGGCYIPIRFDAEIEIHRTGHYDFLPNTASVQELFNACAARGSNTWDHSGMVWRALELTADHEVA